MHNHIKIRLAALLLLGKDEIIQSALPFYKTDAILRRINLNCYDDRDIIETNLINKLTAWAGSSIQEPTIQATSNNAR